MQRVLTDRRVALPADLFTQTYEFVRTIEQKIKATYVDADFELLSGPDDGLNLRVYCNAPMWDIIKLVEDDLIALEDEDDIQLFVVPVRHQDREHPPNIRRNGSFGPD